MPIFMDRHDIKYSTAEDVAAGHILDLKSQSKYGVRSSANFVSERSSHLPTVGRLPLKGSRSQFASLRCSGERAKDSGGAASAQFSNVFRRVELSPPFGCFNIKTSACSLLPYNRRLMSESSAP